jgi:hypothetical protein
MKYHFLRCKFNSNTTQLPTVMGGFMAAVTTRKRIEDENDQSTGQINDPLRNMPIPVPRYPAGIETS